MKATYKILTDHLDVNMDENIYLWFFGDIHRDTRECDEDRWKYFLKKAKDTMTDNTFFIGMGDYHDFASTREKRYLSSEGGDLHSSTSNLLDGIAEKHNRDLADELSFMRGRLLGLIEGNHSWRFENGKTSTEDLAERLDTKDMGWLCHYTTILHNTAGHSYNIAVHYILCHGKAGGKTFGITVNQVGDLKSIFPIADVYVMAHDHQRIAHPVSVLIPIKCRDGYQIKQKRQLLCRAGSFMKAYQDQSNSYEIFRLYRPSDLGALKIIISFVRNQSDDKDKMMLNIVAEI